jgi:hypothetical protein
MRKRRLVMSTETKAQMDSVWVSAANRGLASTDSDWVLKLMQGGISPV